MKDVITERAPGTIHVLVSHFESLSLVRHNHIALLTRSARTLTVD